MPLWRSERIESSQWLEWKDFMMITPFGYDLQYQCHKAQILSKDNIKYYQYKHIGSLLKDVKNTGSNMWNFPQRAWPISLFSCLFGFRIIIMGLSIKIKYLPLEKSKYSSIPFFWNIPLIPTFCSLFLNFLRLWLYRCTFSDLLSGSKYFFF